MAAINFPTVPNNAPVVSRVGTDDVFCELSFRRLGGMIELVCTRVEWHAFTGRYDRDELDREIVEVEDAESVACDLQYIAKASLEETNDYGPADPCDFETAVSRELDADPEEAREYMEYAVEHNAALIAAE